MTDHAEVTVRLATLADYDAVVALLGQLNPDDRPPERAAGEGVLGRILELDGMDLLVAEVEGGVAGTCYLNVIPNLSRDTRPYALIENVVTDSAHRGRGIGRAMMARAVALAWQAGCYKVMLLTGRNDPGVHAFYQRCGFSGDEKRAFVCRR